MKVRKGLAILMAMAAVNAVRAGDGVDPAWLALKDCPSQPGCPAIILLDDQEFNHESNRTRYNVHRIIKLFTEEGVQRYADVSAPSAIGGFDVRNLAGRTIQPDGSAIKLTQDHIHVKTLRKGKRWERTKSAKFPGVQPGAIIEYSYDVFSEQNSFLTELTWYIQARLPVVESRFTLKPGKLGFVYVIGGSEQVAVEHQSPFKNVTYYKVRNVRAIPEEPMGPPEEALQARLLFDLPEFQSAWLGTFAARIAGWTGEFVTDAPGVREKVAGLGAGSQLDTLKKIYRFVQEKIDTEDRRAAASGEEALKQANNAGEVLQRGFGNEIERALLFVAMAREAGMECGLLLLAGRFSSAFNPSFPDEDQFDSYAVAVKVGAGWTFYDPAARHCPFGMISAEKEGGKSPNGILLMPMKGAHKLRSRKVQNLLLQTPEPVTFSIATIPASAAARNILKREARITFGSGEGMEAVVTDQGTGLVDLAHRQAYETRDEAGRLEALRERLLEMFPVVEVASAQFEDIESFDKAATVRYTLRFPAEPQEGDRLLITPSLFHAGEPMTFTSETRQTEVRFEHARREQERVAWVIPEGYEIEDMPMPIIVKDPPFSLMVSYSMMDGALVMSRTVEVDAVSWPASDYARLRSFFEKVHEADGRVISLRKKAS